VGIFDSFFKNQPNKVKTEQDEELEKKEIAERQTMIKGISELDDLTVREVMIPRIDVDFLNCDVTLDEFYSIIKTNGYSRYPVYEDNYDNVIGVLYAKDLLRKGIRDSFDVKTLMRKAYFVPESKHLDDLLRDFKKRKVHIAIAVDEYGGVAGIVCLEDILEVIVGEIQDEFDEDEEEEIRKIGEHTYLVEARCSIEDLNEELDLKLNEEDFETLGGFVFELFGRIPLNGEEVEYEDLKFKVENIEGHKINTIEITKKM
jgi:CBS domain containing-hemolysin-like protein